MKRTITLLAGLLALSTACSSATSEDDAAGADSAQTGKKPVTGAKAERLLAALGNVGAPSDVKGLTCLTASNTALDEDAPLFDVPITTCTFADKTIADAAQKAGVLYDAIAAVDEELEEGAAGTYYASAKSIVCEGQGPGAGSDPANPPPTTVSCKVTSGSGRVIEVDAKKSARLAQAFGLFDVIDHAMGGRFGVEANDVTCAKHPNTALDENAPLFGVATHGCTMKVPGMSPEEVKADDAEPKALALLDSLEKAGAVADSAMGKTGVSLTEVSCTKKGATTSCSLR